MTVVTNSSSLPSAELRPVSWGRSLGRGSKVLTCALGVLMTQSALAEAPVTEAAQGESSSEAAKVTETPKVTEAGKVSEEVKKNKEKQDEKQKGRKHRSARAGKDFQALDADKDGFLSFEEFSKSSRLSRVEEPKRKKLFDYLDRNKDGKLELHELRPRPPRWLVSLRKEFDTLDENKSGGLSFEQFSKASQLGEKKAEEKKRIFKWLDRNRDGEIQRKELTHSKSMGGYRGKHGMDIKKYDADKSGGLSFDEYSKMPWVERIPEERRKALFQKLDANKDGEIRPDELRKLRASRGRHGSPHSHRQQREKRPDSGKPQSAPDPDGRPPKKDEPQTDSKIDSKAEFKMDSESCGVGC